MSVKSESTIGGSSNMNRILLKPVGIIGAGPSGLITAHVLHKDGFTNIQIISQDKSVGGVWARERVYPGMFTNNVHGELRFSSLPMPPPKGAAKTGARLSGADVSSYMEKYADTHLRGKVKFMFEKKAVGVRREKDGRWTVNVQDLRTGDCKELYFSRIVLCTGGCSVPKIPESISPYIPKFRGPVVHSSESWSRMEEIISSSRSSEEGRDTIVVVGGGKSAQDISAYLTNRGEKVTMVYQTIDMFIGGAKPLPKSIRRSRLISVMSPHIKLKTPIERFLHKTWLGSKIVHYTWDKIANDTFKAYSIPKDSPLRIVHPLFWGLRSGDEGVYRPDSFHALVNTGKIQIIAPARMTGFSEDGSSVLLSTGQAIKASAVILATGFASSWDDMIDKSTAEELGIGRRPAQHKPEYAWNYKSLRNPPCSRPNSESLSTTMYRGIIPAKNIFRRDFATNGAIYTANSAYFFELCAHWISSYFLEDEMNLPRTVEETLDETEMYSAWVRRRFPDAFHARDNSSHASAYPYLCWPQAADELLEDLYLPSMRSGGNWLTWLFRPIRTEELLWLSEERREKRDKRMMGWETSSTAFDEKASPVEKENR